jgi:hypothetical protein
VDNDKIFATYTLTLIAAVASVITASVAAGFATVPTAGVFLEHVALSLTFRGMYKSFGGFEWAYAVAEFAGMITEEATPAPAGAEAMS